MSMDGSEERFRINDDVCRHCGSRYKNGKAKLLPCLHTFCEKCLGTFAQLQDTVVEQAGSLNRLVCPSCQSSCSADEVITSPFLQSSSNPELQCYDEPCSSYCCNSCTQAASFCLECSDFLCSGCVDAHKRVKLTRVHSLMDLGPDCQSPEQELDGDRNTSILCQSHPFPAQLHCLDCESLICFKCRIQNHKEHLCNVVHMKNNLSADQKLKLKENLNILKSDIKNVTDDNLIKVMDQKEEHIKQQKDKLKKLMNNFNRCLTDLQTFMDGIFDDELKSISNKHGEISKFRTRTEHTIDFFEQVMQTSDDISILAVKSLLFRNIGTLESELITTHRCALEGFGRTTPVTTTVNSYHQPPARLHSQGNVTAHSSTRNSHHELSADLDKVKQEMQVEEPSEPQHGRNGGLVDLGTMDFIQGVETDPDPDESLQPMDSLTVSNSLRSSPMLQAAALPATSTVTWQTTTVPHQGTMASASSATATATSQTKTVSDQGTGRSEDTGPRTPSCNIPQADSSPHFSSRLASLAIQDVRSVAGDWWEDGQAAPSLDPQATGPSVTARSEMLVNGASCRKKRKLADISLHQDMAESVMPGTSKQHLKVPSEMDFPELGTNGQYLQVPSELDLHELGTNRQYLQVPSELDLHELGTNRQYLQVPSELDLHELGTNGQHLQESQLDPHELGTNGQHLHESNLDLPELGTKGQHLHESNLDLPGLGTNEQNVQGPSVPSSPESGTSWQDAQRPSESQSHRTIWKGLLECKGKNGAVTRSLDCTVTVASTDHAVETVQWPRALPMQLMQPGLLDKVGPHLKASKRVSFHLQQAGLSDPCKKLKKNLENGYTGFIYFPLDGCCSIQFMLLLYSAAKKAYFGLIPVEQKKVLAEIKKAVTQHKQGRGKNIPRTVQDESKARVTAYRDANEREANYYLANHDPDDPWEDLCRVCQEGGDVVLCEWCPRVYHKHCYVPTLTQDPPSPWQCDLCQELEEISTGPQAAAGDGNRRCKRKHSGSLSDLELKVCERILLELYCVFESIIFHKPVSAERRDYYKMIKKPMAFSTIKTKLRRENSSHYACIEDFLFDVNLVFSNCYKFNIDNPDIYEACEMTETLFKALVEKHLPQFSVNLD